MQFLRYMQIFLQLFLKKLLFLHIYCIRPSAFCPMYPIASLFGHVGLNRLTGLLPISANFCVLFFFPRFRTWIMNFLDNTPSENRMEFTKLQVACKYASIERVCVYSWFTVCCEIWFRKKNSFLFLRFRLSDNSERHSAAFALRFVLNQSGLAVISNWVMT